MNLEAKDLYQVQIASRSERSSVPCKHGCNHVIQLVSSKTQKTELELCEVDAERIAAILLDSVEISAKLAVSK